jgi:hypothetical protein
MPKKKNNNTVAKAAAAAATAAVNAAAQADNDKVWLWSNEDEEEENSELNDEIMEGLQQIDEAAAGEIVWWELYCDSPLEKQGLVRKMGTAELKGLRTECLGLGPGEYHVIARTKRGRFVKGSRQRIQISGFAKSANNTSTSVAPSVDPLVLLSQMEERMERRRLAARAERMAEVKFWAPILAPIGIELAKGLFGRGGNGESIKDMVAAMVGMKDLVGGGGKDVDNLLKGIELARDLEPANSKGSTWPDVIATGVTSLAKEFRPLAETLAARRNGTPVPLSGPTQLQFQPAASPSPTPPGQSTHAHSEPPPSAASEAAGDTAMLALVEPVLRRLAIDLEEFATNAADPALAAEALLAKVPRTLKSMVQPEQLKGWLSLPNWWELTVGFHPALQPYQAFCDDVRLELLVQLEPPEDQPEGSE